MIKEDITSHHHAHIQLSPPVHSAQSPCDYERTQPDSSVDCSDENQAQPFPPWAPPSTIHKRTRRGHVGSKARLIVWQGYYTCNNAFHPLPRLAESQGVLVRDGESRPNWIRFSRCCCSPWELFNCDSICGCTICRVINVSMLNMLLADPLSPLVAHVLLISPSCYRLSR